MNNTNNIVSPTTEITGRILIVDDDPVAAGMLGVSLSDAGNIIVEASSGEDALNVLAGTDGPLPDIVFLDIEMGMGIDGYETCRRLRAIDTLHELPVIFLSGHDGLDDRLKAYDAGGSDFLAKPFVPDEVLRKSRVAILHRRRLTTLESDRQSSTETATAAMMSLGENGVALKFCRGALETSSLSALATLTVKSMASLGLICHCQVRTSSETLTQTSDGPASPLEESVIEMLRSMERIFSFRGRMVFNFERVSLLVTNMPIKDEDLCGRIRDVGAIIAEAAELAVSNIEIRNDAIRRAQELRQLSETSRLAVEELRESYRDMQVSSRLELENLTDTIEDMYVQLGLTDRQEFTISDTVRNAVDRVLTQFDCINELDARFTGISDGLSKAADYEIVQVNDAPLQVEIW